MVDWAGQDPSRWGWARGAYAHVEPLDYRGYRFPQGVAAATGPIWAEALDRLTRAGLVLPPDQAPSRAGMWGLANRLKTSGSAWSFHAYGIAIDVCAPWNPSGVARPPASPHRMPEDTGALVHDLGLLWGGTFSVPDWMHLELHLSPDEAAGLAGDLSRARRSAPKLPYPLPADHYYGVRRGGRSVAGGYVSIPGPWRAGLIAAQQRLGVTADGLFGPITEAAVKAAQRRYGLTVDGLLGPKTWAAIFPGTS